MPGHRRHVSWYPGTKQFVRRAPAANHIDLDVTGHTHRAYAHASAAVVHRAAPPRVPDEQDLLTLALTSRSKDRWRAEQAALTKAFAAAYGSAGGGVSCKQRDLQAEGASSTDEIRREYIPKVRETVRALQETMRLKRLAATNPKIMQAGQADMAREALNSRQVMAVHRMQAACRGLSARREAKRRLSNYRARCAVNAAAQRVGLNLRVAERG